jgi:hypothetical protein
LTAQGHPRATFNRAIERGNLLIAEAIAREIGKVSLGEALELVALIAQHDPRRRGRAVARWTSRFLDANPAAGLDDLALIVGCLSALGGPRHEAALLALRDVSGTASRRTVQPGVG